MPNMSTDDDGQHTYKPMHFQAGLPISDEGRIEPLNPGLAVYELSLRDESAK